MNTDDIENARRILRQVHATTVERLVAFVNDNEEALLGRGEWDSTGATDRLSTFQQELFIVGYLLGSLPQPPQAAAAKPADKAG